MKPQIIEVNGLRFEKSVWDPTPVSWNASGSWAKDAELTAEILDGLRAAIPNHAELVAEALASERDREKPYCGTYWGSHGCDRPPDHPGLCVCGMPGEECSAILKIPCKCGDINCGFEDPNCRTAVLWWGDSEVGLRLSSLNWGWFE